MDVSSHWLQSQWWYSLRTIFSGAVNKAGQNDLWEQVSWKGTSHVESVYRSSPFPWSMDLAPPTNPPPPPLHTHFTHTHTHTQSPLFCTQLIHCTILLGLNCLLYYLGEVHTLVPPNSFLWLYEMSLQSLGTALSILLWVLSLCQQYFITGHVLQVTPININLVLVKHKNLALQRTLYKVAQQHIFCKLMFSWIKYLKNGKHGH